MVNEDRDETSEGMDLNAVVREWEEVLRPLLPQKVALALHLAPSLALVGLLNSGRKQDCIQHFKWVMHALLQNAIEAMPNGGQLVIETMNTCLNEADADRLTTYSGPRVMFSVTDTGCGMDNEARSRCFEPFFSTKGRHGLGLATSCGILRSALSGVIEADSQPGGGTCFRIYLPICPQFTCR